MHAEAVAAAAGKDDGCETSSDSVGAPPGGGNQARHVLGHLSGAPPGKRRRRPGAPAVLQPRGPPPERGGGGLHRIHQDVFVVVVVVD